MRDKRFSRIDTATTQKNYISGLLNIAHALSWRGKFSFLDLDAFTLEDFVEEACFGADALLHASERLENWVQENRRDHGDDAVRRMVDPVTMRLLPHLIFKECNLPPTVGGLPRVAQILTNLAFDIGVPPPIDGTTASDLPALEPLTQTSIGRYLVPLELMYAMRRKMDAETITFPPFPDVGANEMAKVRGKASSRTKTPPPEMALKLMEYAACKIRDYSDLDRIKSATASETREVLTACWIAVATFTARRFKEIYALEDDFVGGETPSGGCLHGSDASGWYLHIHIVKTLKEKAWLPVPLMVVRAVQILRVISADARETSGKGKKYLFMRSTLGGRAERFRPQSFLDSFANQAGALDEGSIATTAPWHWTPHQFRRFFCVLYFYRWEGASIEVLSHFLRHFDIEMTRKYVEQDPDAASFFKDARWRFERHFSNTIASGERVVSGAAGDRLKLHAKRIKERLTATLSVVSPERVGARLKSFIQQEGMVLTPKPWVTCTCPKTAQAASTAACRLRGNSATGGEGPDFAHAEPTVCGGCPHAVFEQGKRKVLSEEIEHLTAVKERAGCLQTIFGELEAARLVQLEAVHESSFYRAVSAKDQVL
ncbi:tyrosine-type recombinase/integrase [Tardiphaga sp. OK245]|uniref:tyrosine-type recombinase/integrase n=1 Tax=Tardiphaga sp. OK245 TaxID=1855306 RepID=UPI00147E0A8D|nr:tyrosine-type recombinase/integrase [Tardiphaga sp. OK245]